MYVYIYIYCIVWYCIVLSLFQQHPNEAEGSLVVRGPHFANLYITRACAVNRVLHASSVATVCQGREVYQCVLDTYTHTHTYTHSYITCVTYIHKCIHYIHTYITYTHKHTCIHTFMHCVHPYVHTYIQTYVRTYVHTCIHTYTYIHAYIHT
jgi:hypothetical protein